MGRLNTSTYILSIAGIIVCGGISVRLQQQGKSLYDIISSVGSIASLFGLAIAIVQISSLKRISAETRKAVQDTKAELVQSISISDISKAIKIIEQVQMYAGHKHYESAHLRMQDLRVLLIQFQGNTQLVKVADENDFQSLLTDLSIHILNMYEAVYLQGKEIEISTVNKTLESITAVLVSLENALKYSRGIYERASD